MNLLHLASTARHALPRLIPLMRHSSVPLWLKLGAGAAGLLIISPLDLFGDIPILGALDDAVLLLIVANMFILVAERIVRRRDAQPMREVRVIGPNALQPADASGQG
ncbi:MAG: hypothetical protein ACLPYS_18740 [Vulcanimicrobiaceae bacterium]